MTAFIFGRTPPIPAFSLDFALLAPPFVALLSQTPFDITLSAFCEAEGRGCTATACPSPLVASAVECFARREAESIVDDCVRKRRFCTVVAPATGRPPRSAPVLDALTVTVVDGSVREDCCCERERLYLDEKAEGCGSVWLVDGVRDMCDVLARIKKDATAKRQQNDQNNYIDNMRKKKKKHKHRRSVLAAFDASDEVVVSCKAPSTVYLGRSPPSEWNRKKKST